jgi:hypothetical protein
MILDIRERGKGMLVEADLSYAGISVITVLSAGIGAFFGAYLKQKAENLATHEDFQKVLTELKETTRATKEIENKLLDTMWDRQKRWELKRDVLIDIATKLATANNALLSFHALCLTEIDPKSKGNPGLVPKRLEIATAWNTATSELQRVVVIASLACSAEVVTALNEFALFVMNLAAKISAGDSEVYMQQANELFAKHGAISKAMRKEIGNDDQPMSPPTVSMAVPSPGSPVLK